MAVQSKSVKTSKNAVSKSETAAKNLPASPKNKFITITFQLAYSTNFGETVYVMGNIAELGNNQIEQAIPMNFLNQDFWAVSLKIDKKTEDFSYAYFIKKTDSTIQEEDGKNKIASLKNTKNQLLIIDSWNYAGYQENVFYTRPFVDILLKNTTATLLPTSPKNTKFTHIFKVRTPFLKSSETLCLLGNTAGLGEWQQAKAILMEFSPEDKHYTCLVDLSKAKFPVEYKYGIYDIETQQFVQYETDDNRILYDTVAPQKTTLVRDTFAQLPFYAWRAAGLSIPVFSLKTKDSWGVGDFLDLKLLADWCAKMDMQLIQILPVNDTTVSKKWTDSYPYAAISAFALHPIYLNPTALATKKNQTILDPWLEEAQRLNDLPTVEYEQVLALKNKAIDLLFPLQKNACFKTKAYKEFYAQNENWLLPYAVFCCLRDAHKTAVFTEWKAPYNAYKEGWIGQFVEKNKAAVEKYFFTQFQLHQQLLNASDYAHKKGIILKGDITIGVNRWSVDSWQNPQLFNMDMQAGAPPDDFAQKGQNWGFPTYNWKAMYANNFAWWQARFKQMGFYFDAFRIDHILGFFRIWSIPYHAVEGIMGYFVPALPLSLEEIKNAGVGFDYDRFTQPFVNEAMLNSLEPSIKAALLTDFLHPTDENLYQLKSDFDTQRKVEEYFNKLEKNDFNLALKTALFNLISNVLLFDADLDAGLKNNFHCRIDMEKTASFKFLQPNVQAAFKQLYVHYFYEKQEDIWKQAALEKLPLLKKATDMLICGEDLGMVPATVPKVMKDLGLLSLEIQRMPKQTNQQFFHPKTAPYLSVCTPGTHDMSTLRAWWEENAFQTQLYYNTILEQYGLAPEKAEEWIIEKIIEQHLESTAMWSIFQIQDILGIDKDLKNANSIQERINIPANPMHYWNYRLHQSLEALLNAKTFNEKVKTLVKKVGRSK